ncbi:uncharacterized protein LOC142656105 [Rhinoderma darwinii]|uniref:uncharacterized protein LOC142656105 n=1 Tax=Rhinoderma darwinii TaxID=43563 RepID=UPI003F67BC98
MSDDWTSVMWKNRSSSSLWVVTKSSYSFDWINDVLKSNIFDEYKSDGEATKFEIHGGASFKNRVSSGSCVMFCLEYDKWDSHSMEEVESLSSYYALKNVVILLSEGAAEEPLSGQMKDQCTFPILNFSKDQVTWYKNHLTFYSRKMGDMRDHVGGSAPWKGHKVGIFSRSSESEFKWLRIQLESGYFRHVIENVRPCFISNSGFQQFMTNVSNCSFGILYHTKNRGRINITDVTDSLYDEELEYMSGMLDKNVMVVVDDLQNADEEEKSRLLRSQPSIKEKAKDLFLFTTDEKKYLEPLVKMRNVIHGENK